VGKGRAKPRGTASDRGCQAPCKGLLVWPKGCKGHKDSAHELYTSLGSSLQSLTLIPAARNEMMAVKPRLWAKGLKAEADHSRSVMPA